MAFVATGGATGSVSAAIDAARQARAGLGERRASYGFVFASPSYDLGSVLQSVREIAGTPDVIGCATAGEITAAGLTHGGVSVMLVADDTGVHRTAYGEGLKRDPRKVADALCRPLDEARRDARARDLDDMTTIVLTDALGGAGEPLVAHMREQIPLTSPIVGGAAGDEGAFQSTAVGALDRAAPDAAAALHVFSRRGWGVGVDHGLRPTTKPMRVTRASGNVVFELDGRPAFEAYRAHAKQRGVELTTHNAGPYMIGNELGIHFFQEVRRARAPLFANADGSLSCAASIPEGAMVSILDGEPEQLLAAARKAAQNAAEALRGGPCAGVLLFDCICRGMILKERFDEEIAGVRAVFGEVPVAGFLTYGEIARYTGSLDGWHNATAVVVAIPA